MGNIGEIIKRARLAKNLTTVELAQKVGVSQGTISNIENDKRKGNEATLNKIFDVLEIEKNKAKVEGQERIIRAKQLTRARFTEMEIIIATGQLKPENYDSLDEDEIANIDFFHRFESKIMVETLIQFLEEHQSEIKERTLSNIRAKYENLKDKQTSSIEIE